MQFSSSCWNLSFPSTFWKKSWNFLLWSQCVSLLEKLWPSVIYWPSTVKNIKSAFLWHLIQKQLFERFFQRGHNSLCDEKRGRLLQYRSPITNWNFLCTFKDFFFFQISPHFLWKTFWVEAVELELKIKLDNFDFFRFLVLFRVKDRWPCRSYYS